MRQLPLRVLLSWGMSPTRQSLSAVLLLAAVTTGVVRGQPPCNPAVLLDSEGDLPGQPLRVPTDVAMVDAQFCAEACANNTACVGYNFLGPAASCASLPTCPFAPTGGCCWLKSAAATADSTASKGCPAGACSFIVRPPTGSVPPVPPATPPVGAKNVLYILVDDMRPDAAPFGQAFMHTPNLSKFARSKGAVVFNRTYTGIAVCSPSRMSSLTGRYPHRTLTWNFVNHFRQSTCVERTGVTYGTGAGTPVHIFDGGAGQCCSLCSASAACVTWTLTGHSCMLYNASTAATPAAGSISGHRGTNATRSFVSLPEHFTRSGFLTLSSGKVFHTEEGGSGPPPWDAPGSGMPPLQDPPSWSFAGKFSMANVNALAPMRPCEGTGSSPCSINATAEGAVDPTTTFRFCDEIIGDDAIAKLRIAAAERKSAGTPFFLAVGFRKPHLPFRHPAPYDALYPDVADIILAKHQTMGRKIPPVAYHSTSLAVDPYVPLPATQAKLLRRDYYSSISWTDFQIGRVLNELDVLGLTDDTAVVFHADHGWSLGELGEWEKFTLWEAGTRVPMIVRAPWLNNTVPSSAEIVELIDVFPTLAALAGAPIPASYGLDGSSFVPALTQAKTPTAAPPKHSGAYALSVYPRCPANVTDPSLFWRDNDCLLTERTLFAIMGLSLRVTDYRYTEWRWWNSTNLSPAWDLPPIGVELYDHTGDTGGPSAFDEFEFVSVADEPAYAAVQLALAGTLKEVYPSGSAWPTAAE